MYPRGLQQCQTSFSSRPQYLHGLALGRSHSHALVLEKDYWLRQRLFYQHDPISIAKKNSDVVERQRMTLKWTCVDCGDECRLKMGVTLGFRTPLGSDIAI